MNYIQIFFVNIFMIWLAEGCVKLTTEERIRIVPLNITASEMKTINETYTVVTTKCCEGYRRSKGSENCEPVCSNCENGVCEFPEVCLCNVGYEQSADTLHCEPVCDNCVNGVCNAPNVCTCMKGYQKNNESNACLPVCDNCLNGSCISPGVCRCFFGYQLNETSKLCEPKIKKDCSKLKANDATDANCGCSEGYIYDVDSEKCEPICEICVNGNCTSPGICTCWPGYQNRNASSTGVCEPVCKIPCENGTCVSPDICKCKDGFEVSSVSGRCEPTCEKGCENGICLGVNQCECLDGFVKAADSNDCIWACINETCVNGYCGEKTSCVCNEGFDFLNGSHTECQPICHPPELCDPSNNDDRLNDSNSQNVSFVGCQPSEGCRCDKSKGPCVSHNRFHWLLITALVLIVLVLVIAAIAIGLNMIQTEIQSGSYTVSQKRTSCHDSGSTRDVKEYSREAFV